MGSDDEGPDDEKHYTPKQLEAHRQYRQEHPKKKYPTAKKAAQAMQELKRKNIGNTHYEKANDRLESYYDCDDGCYYLGHRSEK